MNNDDIKKTGAEVCQKWGIEPEKIYDIHLKFMQMIDDLPLEICVSLLVLIIRSIVLNSDPKSAKFVLDSISLNLKNILGGVKNEQR